MVSKLKLLLYITLFLKLTHTAQAQQIGALSQDFIIDTPGAIDDFPIVTKEGMATPINYDISDHKGVIRAVGDLQSDIERVTGKVPELTMASPTDSPKIIVGTLGKSKVIDNLVAQGKLDVKSIKGKWESFIIATINDSKSNSNKSLVIVGSDKRGTIYGIYELSRQLGVSPWYWWADVPAKQRASAYVVAGRYVSEEPKVRYRGIFINDEAPCFTGWCREKFGGVNSKMYTHMFELLLRLRANYLWPAMWGNAFNEDDPLNPKLADEYGIVMGTSHHEPMMRSQREWGKHRKDYGNGEWNYKTNAEGLQKFWQDGLERNKDYEQVITMAMRGDGDLPMDDTGSAEENFKLIEQIMADQRKIIKKVTKKPIDETPQIWALYSEVLEYYDQGIKVPDDMIVLLCDDNWGDVRRLPELDGKKHPGGYGIYYHVDLHGAPRAYQWLNMTQIPHMWEQLQLTYSYGVDKVWILNVGDLKPNEYPMDFFLNMAWNPTAFSHDNLDTYAFKFCEDKFGKEAAKEAAGILSLYCKYASRVTAEMLDDRTYNLENGEFLQVKDAYLALEAKARRQYETLPNEYKDTYMQLVLHPVRAMANLYDMYYALAMNKKLAAEKDLRANDWADQVEKCFAIDAEFTKDYNLNVSEGKWNHIMDQTHIGYRSWDEPRGGNVMPKVVRISPEEAKTGGYVFSEKNRVVVMEAEHYYGKRSEGNTSWTVIPDLGRTLSGIALMPYTEKTEGAYLSYRIHLDSPQDSIKIRLFFDSTLPFKKGGHHVSVSVGQSEEKTININEDLNWKHNYSKMYPAGAARIIETDVSFPIEKTEDGFYTIQIRPLDPGIVLYKVIVDNGGYENSRLNLRESPYTKE
ncbi:glycosyl hydrolase 115 family protein [Flavobacteriaceae bacterium XHP0103]|uniref:glycosyl hydrolase 115 family protein n=1 Tax=Marixanthotalea marina TaxID=2844359 RepID=UPI002989CFFE|nr:glycosyl hydrolase 115 family protein [Marixanthotalea marina]MBU3820972.1 glycosyl hydrolase 115 family protein [Marixanthotalea marina]